MNLIAVKLTRFAKTFALEHLLSRVAFSKGAHFVKFLNVEKC